MGHRHQSDQVRFVSVRWKVFLSTTLVLGVVFGVFVGGTRVFLNQQLKSDEQRRGEAYARQLNQLLQLHSDRIQQLAATIPDAAHITEAIGLRDTEALQQRFRPTFWSLQVDSNINQAGFYSIDNEVLAAWNSGHITPRFVQSVLDNERPVSRAYCRESDCSLLVAIPLLIDGELGGVFALGAPLSDIVVGLAEATESQTLLLAPQARGTAFAGQESLWGLAIVAATERARQTVMMQVLSQRVALERLQQGPYQFTVEGRHYSVMAIPLADGFLLGTQDITAVLNGFDQLLISGAVFSALGLALAILMLTYVLNGPMRRFRALSLNLPLLARGQFDKARARFNHDRRYTRLQDESDMLNATAADLGDQLESLQSSLVERAEELESEKTFVSQLLNTVQAIILTQRSDGEILTINHFGAHLLGLSPDQPIGQNFFHLTQQETEADRLRAAFAGLCQGESSEHHYESQIRGRSRLDIAWHHVLLNRSRGEILTMGVDISVHKRTEQHLSWLAAHDTLTGLHNRRSFSEHLGDALARAVQAGQSGAVLFFDLDQFKDINDTSGHQVGDQFLVAVAETLRTQTRASDFLARLGGDEFAIVMEGITPDELETVCERYCQSLTQVQVPGSEAVHLCTASIGVALFPQHGSGINELLANADLAMYRAKQAGRNTWRLYDEALDAKSEAQERVFWNEQVKRALEQDVLDMHYQPIMDLANEQLSHFEALLRVRQDEGPPLPPFKLIQAAERLGLIQQLDRRIMSQVLKDQAQLRDNGQHVVISINLSGLSLSDPELLPTFERELQAHGLSADNIVFEITETAAVADLKRTREHLETMRKTGCRFALDDFGVGFSSINYLRQLPIDFIKIDGSFIRHLADTPDDQVLVKAVVEVAKAFGQKTVAEFVEDAATVELLKTLDVDYAQGYHIGKPEPLDRCVCQPQVDAAL